MIPVAIEPSPGSSALVSAVRAAGGVVVEARLAEVIVWERGSGAGLREVLDAAPLVKWVQLSSAGVEWLFDEKIYSSRFVWTCAKGGRMGQNVAEVAMLLLLSARRGFHTFVRARQWLPEQGRTFAGSKVAVVGAGGIGEALIRRLLPFDVEVTVLRRSQQSMAGVDRVLGLDRLDEVIPQVDAVVLALPLTGATRRLIDARRLALFRPDAWLINVARGGLVDTNALVRALAAGKLGGAGLDVVDPEPLPSEHPLWTLPNVIITPHIANTRAMAPEAMVGLVKENLERWSDGRALLGRIDAAAGF